jgi:glucokinase
MLISSFSPGRPRVDDAEATFLVGDVGGTNCRLATAVFSGGSIVLGPVQRFKCADFSTAEEVIDAFLARGSAIASINASVIAVAGPVSNGMVQSTNMPWRMSEAALEGHGFGRVKLINDFTALVLSIPHLGAEDLRTIGAPEPRRSNETAAVIGAGTGFGAGALARGLDGHAAIPTEGGHVSFAPVDEVEIEILRILTRRFGRVSVERLLSGPGLINLRHALAVIEGRPSADLHPEEIVRGAEAGDALSAAAVDRFCAIYGSVAGDFALAYGARGGVFLGGGIAPAILGRLQTGSFRRRFEEKGRFQDYLAAVPTAVIINSNAALLGAANLASNISI